LEYTCKEKGVLSLEKNSQFWLHTFLMDKPDHADIGNLRINAVSLLD